MLTRLKVKAETKDGEKPNSSEWKRKQPRRNFKEKKNFMSRIKID